VHSMLLIGGAFAAAAVHSLIPDHWLPFVLVAQARGWRLRRAVLVALVGGLAHLASTVVVGLVAVGVSTEASHQVGEKATWVVSLVVICLGLYFTYQGARRAFHPENAGSCWEPRCSCGGIHPVVEEGGKKDRSDLALGALLGFRPCPEAIPIFLLAGTQGAFSSTLAVGAYALGAVMALVVAVGLSMLGISRLQSGFVVRYGQLIAGVIILAMGLVLPIITGYHHHHY